MYIIINITYTLSLTYVHAVKTAEFNKMQLKREPYLQLILTLLLLSVVVVFLSVEAAQSWSS